MSLISTPMKWMGGKHYLAERIIDLMPSHIHYVEPYAGGLSVLLAKDPEGVSEVVNDLDGNVSNFWDTLRDPIKFVEFQRRCLMTPVSEAVWEAADPRDAWGFFVRCRMSLSGRMESFHPLSKTRIRRGMNEQASAWLSAVEDLDIVHERLKRVVIRNAPALQIIEEEDRPQTLFYLDPPYLHQTRFSNKYYCHEMSDADHLHMLETVNECKGQVMISGYNSKLYDDNLKGWSKREFFIPNNSATGDDKRQMTEVLWMNYAL